ncbi:MAG: DUF3089 domain-containing protein [Pseudomonadota bacterium]|nr:DUF3089 domain-containing protein [Pseudomonadota bacterium]
MCARRFLFLIFFLTLIMVAGAFAVYQFGASTLTRMATPQGRYEPPSPRSGPDYKLASSWLARPGIADNPAAWVPDGVVTTIATSPAATFYIHPTTYLDRDRWNAALDPGGDAGFRARLFVQSQASAFNAVSDIWAPRYRQAAFGAFLLKSEDATKALDLAYRDVRAAFDAFLAAQPAGTPVILAGHSQGALHLSRLLIDRRAALKGRLVAAYVVGWPLSVSADLPATGLPPCNAPDQTGCVLSWQSFAEPANPSLVLDSWVGSRSASGVERKRDDMLCTNPLNGARDGDATPDTNLGTLVPNGDLASATIAVGQVGARCEDGFLIVNGRIPPLGPYVLPGNNYHVYDYALFWGSIRADVERRLAAFRA